MRDYYKILQVSRTASAAEIRQARRLRLRLYHPDINKAPDAEKKARLINIAADTLLLPSARARYDSRLAAADKARQRAASPRQSAAAAAKHSKNTSHAAKAQAAAKQENRPNGIFDFIKTAGKLALGLAGIFLALKAFALLAALLRAILPVFLCLAVGFYLLKALSRLLAR